MDIKTTFWWINCKWIRNIWIHSLETHMCLKMEGVRAKCVLGCIKCKMFRKKKSKKDKLKPILSLNRWPFKISFTATYCCSRRNAAVVTHHSQPSLSYKILASWNSKQIRGNMSFFLLLTKPIYLISIVSFHTSYSSMFTLWKCN